MKPDTRAGHPTWVLAVAVAVGGALGALARHGLDVLLPDDPWSWGVLLANVVGAGLLALIAGRSLPEPVAAGLGTGAIGAFTTFSALAVATAEGFAARPLAVLAYVGLTFAFGWGAAAAAERARAR